jgi:hypothetical protein
MKRTHVMLVAMVMATVVAAAGAMAQAAAGGDEKEATAAKAPAMTKAVYVCPDCHTMSMTAGKCAKCEKEMKAMHVLGTKDGQALLCACGADCKCDAKDMKEGKCGCGKDVVKMSAKGMYVCPMGCAEISDKAGKCACGMEMKKVE